MGRPVFPFISHGKAQVIAEEKEKKNPAIRKAFVSLSRSSLSLRCNPCFPLAYKRESRASHERREKKPSNPEPIRA